jgi:hypothetical protein
MDTLTVRSNFGICLFLCRLKKSFLAIKDSSVFNGRSFSPVSEIKQLCDRGNCFQDLPFTVVIPDCFLIVKAMRSVIESCDESSEPPGIKP